MRLLSKSWWKKKLPDSWDYTLVNDWGSKTCTEWNARLCLFDIQAYTCHGPPKCRANHFTFIIVFVNFGFRVTFEWERKNVGEATEISA